jgi:hypothetical protein
MTMPASFELVARNGMPITTIEEWRAELNKREQAKFVPFYSAYETARAWTEPNRVPPAVAALFERPPLAGFQLERAIVEERTWFDQYGGPRYHDLLLTARADRERLAIVGIEAKVNEDFGGTLKREHERAVANGLRDGYVSNMPKRLHGLSAALLNRDLTPEQPYDPQDAELQYQLLSALAGTLVEAHLAQADVAMMLVHEFQTPLSNPGVAQRSSGRIQELLKRFGRQPTDELPVGQPLGEFVVRGGGKIPAEATFYVAKVRTVVKT